MFLAASLTRLGCASIPCAVLRAAEILGRSGIPAAERDGSVFVREDACPAPKASVLVDRKTAYCQRMDRRCQFFASYANDAVECLAPRSGVRTAGIADVLPTQVLNVYDKLSPVDRHLLFITVGLLTPTVIKRVRLWLRKKKQRRQQAADVAVGRAFAQKLLRTRKRPYSYDPITGLYSLKDRRFSIRKDGVTLVGPAGREYWPLSELTDRLPAWLDG